LGLYFSEEIYIALTALIIGSNGQDGTLMKFFFDELGRKYLDFNRIGISKNNSLIASSSKLTPQILSDIFEEFGISEIYFLVGENDSDEVRGAGNTSNMGYFWTSKEILYMVLEAIAKVKVRIKFLYANSALIFAGTRVYPQNENTTAKPLEKYALQKLAMASELQYFQEKNDFFQLYNLIFYNHESIYRKPKFFTRKVIESAIKIANSDYGADKIVINKPNAIIDMSHAEDLIANAVNIIDSDKPGTYVFSSGKGIIAKDFVLEVFEFLNLSVDDKVIFSSGNEVLTSTPLIGDCSKIRSVLGQLYVSSKENLSIRLTNDWLRHLG